jgi:hypothetical protein
MRWNGHTWNLQSKILRGGDVAWLMALASGGQQSTDAPLDRSYKIDMGNVFVCQTCDNGAFSRANPYRKQRYSKQSLLENKHLEVAPRACRAALRRRWSIFPNTRQIKFLDR